MKKNCLHILCHYNYSDKKTIRALECSHCGEWLRIDGLRNGEWEKGINKRRVNFLIIKEKK